MKNAMTLLFMLAFVSNSAFANISESSARRFAIQYAKEDKADHSYGGEESIESMTSILKGDAHQIVKLMMIRFYENLDADAPIKKLVKENDLYGPEEFMNPNLYYLVKIDYVDCAQVSNFLAVDVKTGKVLYLFALGSE